MREIIKILDIPFDILSQEEALAVVLEKLNHKGSANEKAIFIATPNPEMVLGTRKNPTFKKILQETDLNIADGIGIIWASKMNGTPLPERVTGVDFMQAICKNIPANTKVFLLGAAEGVAEKVKTKLEQKRPSHEEAGCSTKIVGTYSGSANPSEEEKICALINKSDAEILFVAFGAPKQELWIARNLGNLKKLKLIMGVGGAFDFIADKRKRAPQWMQKLWLEWLYRLIQEPKRIKRIYNATIKFPLTFLKEKLLHP